MTPQVIDVLTTIEQTQLSECEQVIQNGLQTFVEVGHALATIRDGKLYRLAHPTFEDYCQERWHMRKSYAYRLINAFDTVQTLSPTGDISPRSERQVRPLAKLEPAARQAAWDESVKRAGGRQPTADIVEQVADEFNDGTPHIRTADEEKFSFTNIPGIQEDLPEPNSPDAEFVERLLAKMRYLSEECVNGPRTSNRLRTFRRFLLAWQDVEWPDRQHFAMLILRAVKIPCRHTEETNDAIEADKAAVMGGKV